VAKNKKHFRELRLGLILFYESGLEDPVSWSVDQGRLSFAGLEGLAELVEEADMLFTSVDTPQSGDGAADLISVAAVARDIEAGHWRRRTGSACS
jgi:UDPglucose 6-dehydrogenase